MVANLHFKSPYIRFYKRGMYGLICKRMFTIGVGPAKDASHLEKSFEARVAQDHFGL